VKTKGKEKEKGGGEGYQGVEKRKMKSEREMKSGLGKCAGVYCGDKQ
jgi:hypothetical protein